MKSKINQNEGLIRPTRRKRDPTIGLDAVMVMVPSDLEYLAGMTHAQRVAPLDMSLNKLYLANVRKTSLALCGPFLGAPHAVMGMEKLIALGGKRIWVLGWCGSLQPSLRIGDLVIATRAISEEGTSQHYPIGTKLPMTDKALNEMLEKGLQKRKIAFALGTVWSTDAPYRETPAKVKSYQERGVLAVEMEMSALMTLAIYRQVRLAGVLVVSDELFDLEWRPGFSSPRLRKASRLAGEVLVELLSR